MRALLIAFFCMSFIQQAYAEKFTSTIHSIDTGKRKESTLLRFNNGRVTFISIDKTNLLDELKKIMEEEESVRVDIDKNNYLVSAEIADAGVEVEDEVIDSSIVAVDPYNPSVVKNNNAALKIFQKMRKDYTSGGQCYNRAHIWSYEEFQRSRLNTMKIFMFFTESYIRKYKYHWWFHVTPMVYVGNLKSPRTLDRRYTSGPRTTKSWSDIFIKSKRTCPVVKTFNDFWLNQNKQHCYHIYTNMFHVIPRDIETRDLTGIEKTEFDEKTIKKAYKDAFKKGYRAYSL